MKYEELVKKVKRNASKVHPEDILGHIAVQFNIEGDAEGAFYVEFNGGKVTVEPYEYYDRDILIVCSAEQALGMSEVKYDAVAAMQRGEIYVEGNIGRLELLKQILIKSRDTNMAKKAAATKKTAGKTTAKKTTAKSATSKKTATAKKSAGKTSTARKSAASTKSASAKTTAKK